MKHFVDQKTFKGNVYGPVATEISIRPEAPPHAAAVLEVAIANRVMSMFIVEHYEDQDKLRECVSSLNSREGLALQMIGTHRY